MLRLSYRGRLIEQVDHREFIGPDAMRWQQFIFVVDGHRAMRDRVGVDIPQCALDRYKTVEDFETMLARAAVNFFENGNRLKMAA